MRGMKRWIALVLFAALAVWQLPTQAQSRVYSQAELDALLAPVALYPDPVLSNVLVAATNPEDLREAAAWSRANPQLTGEAAVRAADPMPWHPSVKALVAFPDLLLRMGESPQWTADLGAAFLGQEPYVMDTVQSLRQRAQANGSLQSNDQYSVQQQDSSIAIYPVQPQVVYVPYYNPYVVYGPWWWPAYRPVFWRPWAPRPAVFVSTHYAVRSVDWHRGIVYRQPFHRQPVHRQPVHRVLPAPVIQSHVPARPIVDSVRNRPQPGWNGNRTEPRREFHREPRASVPAPVTIRNQANTVRPIVDSVRNLPQPAAQPVQRQLQQRQPHTQLQQRQPHPQFQQQREHRMESRGGNRQQQRRG